MKFLTLTMILLLSSAGFATTLTAADTHDNEMACQVKINGTIKSDLIWASPESSNVVIGDFEGYRIFIHHNANQKFSLEIYDGANTARTYSDTVLRNVGDEVASAIWNRDILLETSCKIHK
ncbi:MAG TPA: hypothetical protein VN132_16300 [Bdellovibrio sp.]|nr:hypothetical protein [Bdellovibrio sp.]